MLSIKERQTRLKALGFYSGAIDGIEGKGTKTGYKLLQDKYFIRAKDKDGKYGRNTDILLQSAYNTHNSKHFKLSEFRCHCAGKYCTGYPVVVSKSLVKNLDSIRDKYGAVRIMSGLRCNTWNSKIGGVKGSKHKLGRASDVFVPSLSGTFNGRKELINTWLTLPDSQMGYCKGYMKYKGKASTNYNSKTMGNSTHLQVN